MLASSQAFEQKLNNDTLFKEYFNLYAKNFENKIHFENGEFEFFKSCEKLYKSDHKTALDWIYKNRYPHFLKSSSNENYVLTKILKLKSSFEFQGFLVSIENSLGVELVNCWRSCYKKVNTGTADTPTSNHELPNTLIEPKCPAKTLQSFRAEFHVLGKYKCLRVGVELCEVMNVIENDLSSYWVPRFRVMSNNRSLSNDATLNDEKAKPSDQNMNNIESIKTELLKPKKPRDLYERSHTQVKRLENKNNTPKMNWRWQITNRPITRDGRMQKDRDFVLESKEDCIGTTLCLLYTDSELGRSFGEFCSNNNQQPETTYLPQSYLNQTHQLPSCAFVSSAALAYRIWSEIQRYKKLFKRDVIAVREIQTSATDIQTQYIIPYMSSTLQKSVSTHINPAFDDLFDDVEEAMLLLLVGPAKNFVSHKRKQFGKLKLTEYKKKLRLAIKALSLKTSHTNKDPLFGMEDFVQSKFSVSYWSDLFLWKQVRGKYRALSFVDVQMSTIEWKELNKKFVEEYEILVAEGVRRKEDVTLIEQEVPDERLEFYRGNFLKYLNQIKYGASSKTAGESKMTAEENSQNPVNNQKPENDQKHDIEPEFTEISDTCDPDFKHPYLLQDAEFWMDVQRIKLHRGGLQEKRDLLNQIKENWVTEGKYFFNSENSPASLDEQKHLAKCAGGWKVLQRSASPLRMDILNEMQRYAKLRVEAALLPMYLSSKTHTSYQKELKKAALKSKDTKKQKITRKRLDSGEFNSDHEFAVEEMQFREALKETRISQKFFNFVSTRQSHEYPFLANDVLFYLEIQKYKDFCHGFKSRQMLGAKVQAMVNSFLQSKISTPGLQVDIAESTAKKIGAAQKELSHLLFQQAQNTIFQILLDHWRQFLIEECEIGSEMLEFRAFEERRNLVQEMAEDVKTPRTEVASKSGDTESVHSSLSRLPSDIPVRTIKFCYSEYFINKSLTIL